MRDSTSDHECVYYSWLPRHAGKGAILYYLLHRDELERLKMLARLAIEQKKSVK